MSPEEARKLVPALEAIAGGRDSQPADSHIIRASSVASKSIRWAWKGRLALGYLTVQTGIEGLGKSVFAAWMIAR